MAGENWLLEIAHTGCRFIRSFDTMTNIPLFGLYWQTISLTRSPCLAQPRLTISLMPTQLKAYNLGHGQSFIMLQIIVAILVSIIVTTSLTVGTLSDLSLRGCF